MVGKEINSCKVTWNQLKCERQNVLRKNVNKSAKNKEARIYQNLQDI